MRADIDARVAAVLQSRMNANASGQAGEDLVHIRAAAAQAVTAEELTRLHIEGETAAHHANLQAIAESDLPVCAPKIDIGTGF